MARRAGPEHRVTRAQLRHVVGRAGLLFIRPADSPERPDEALLFLGDDKDGMPVEVVGVELADGRLRITQHADPDYVPRPVRGGEEVAAVKRSGDEPNITKAGTRLDPDYERRLADEAEAGFDPATLTRRPALPVRPRGPLKAGRPSSRRPNLRSDPANR